MIWVAVAFLVLFLAGAALFLVEKAYRDGVTDGAFKQYKPTVRRIMLEFDNAAARKILTNYDARIDV